MGNIESKFDRAFLQNLKWFNVAFETPVPGEADFSEEMKQMRVNGRQLLHIVETSPSTVATSLGKGMHFYNKIYVCERAFVCITPWPRGCRIM